MIVPTGAPLVQVETTDPRLPWLATFTETALLRAIWYPTTAATLSRQCRLIIRAGLEKTSEDVEGQLPFRLQDFGARGTSSGESAGLGGMVHLVNFMGTDTMEGLMAARRYYGADMAGFSIPAAEHSTMTSWGRACEKAANALRDADGTWHNVDKGPATDPGKASKAGRQAVVLEADRTSTRRLESIADAGNLLRPVWRKGEMLVSRSFDELRARAA